MEMGVVAIFGSQIVRLMQSVCWIPSFGGFQGFRDTPALQLVLAADQFYSSLWPSPVFWIAILGIGTICTLLGMQQTVAAVNTARSGRSPMLLSECGEDDPHFLSSVAAEDLLWDIRLRRIGMSAGMAFFATLGWDMLWKTGLVALLFIALLFMCSMVDNRLWETGRKLSDLVDKRRHAERDAYIQMVTGRKNP